MVGDFDAYKNWKREFDSIQREDIKMKRKTSMSSYTMKNVKATMKNVKATFNLEKIRLTQG